MFRKDPAVSEITAFLLIIALLTAGIGIYAAAVLPELEKAAEQNHLQTAAEKISSLKTGIDRLWTAENPGGVSGELIPLSSGNIPASAGTLFSGKGTEMRFTHAGMEKTVSLLTVSYTHQHNTEERIIYEGGAVFAKNRLLLPHTSGNTEAVLICTEDAAEVILANTPAAVTCTYRKTERFFEISNIRMQERGIPGYWQEALSGISELTIHYISIYAEAVS